MIIELHFKFYIKVFFEEDGLKKITTMEWNLKEDKQKHHYIITCHISLPCSAEEALATCMDSNAVLSKPCLQLQAPNLVTIWTSGCAFKSSSWWKEIRQICT